MNQQEKKFPHQGRNIRRIREMLGIKQEALAWEMGDEWSQKRISLYEQKDVIPTEILEKFARALNVPLSTLKQLDEERFLRLLQTDTQQDPCFTTPDVHLLERWIQAIEENEKLYERLLKSEQEKVQLLQKMLDHCLKQ